MDTINIKITNRWNDCLDKFFANRSDVYFREEYLYAHCEEGVTAECVIIENHDYVLIFPFLKRSISRYAEGFYDIEVPNGYGGPIVTGIDKDFIREAIRLMADELSKRSYVCGLIRFHPLLKNHVLFEDHMNVVFNRNTIAVNLSLPLEDIWNQHIHPKHRNKIRIAERNQLRFCVDPLDKHMDLFKKMYFETMKHNNAGQDYYFSDEYFERLKRLGESLDLLTVCYKNTVISSAIFLKNDQLSIKEITINRKRE
jgi:hypothetical protein